MNTNRKLAAILFSDIVDCTKIISKDEKLGLEYIRQHSLIVNDNVDMLLGDLNQDSIINIQDVILLINISLSTSIYNINTYHTIIGLTEDTRLLIN